MDPLNLHSTAKQFTDQIPGLEVFLDAQLEKARATITESVQAGLSGLADGLGQVLGRLDSLDGATVTIEPSGPIVLPRFIVTVNMPLKAAK